MMVPRRTPSYESVLRTFAEIVWNALVSALKGLRITSYNQFFRERVTVPYPFKKLDVSPRLRGRHRVLLNPDGTPICIACAACQRVCPDACISVTRTKVVVQTPEGEKSVNRPEALSIDLARCMYCNLCAEVCPVSCLHLVADYAYSTGDVRELRIHLEGLIRPEPLSEFELSAKTEPEGG